MMFAPTSNVAFTMIGPAALGSIWRNMMRKFRAPMFRAASTYSRSLRAKYSPRTSRAAYVQPKIAIKKITLLGEPSLKVAESTKRNKKKEHDREKNNQTK